MNEQLTTKPSNNRFQIAAVVLLALILVVQVGSLIVGFVSSTPSKECRDAIDRVAKVEATMPSNLRSMLDNYEKEVYDRADNINQQIFLSNEHIFYTLQSIALLQDVHLQIDIYCRK